MRRLLAPVLLLLVAVAPAPSVAQAPATTVRFLSRDIDLRPYLQGFPYSGWRADYDADRLFYFQETPSGRFLLSTSLRPPAGASQLIPAVGRRLGEVDWSKRTLWDIRYDSLGKGMLLSGDEQNDEVVNLYRLSLADGSLTRLTDVPYLYGWAISHDRRRVAYLARFGTAEPYRSCLQVLQLATGESREVLCDEGSEFRLTWSAVAWRPDDSAVLFRVNRAGRRGQGNLALVDLRADSAAMRVVLPPDVPRLRVGPSGEDAAWIDLDRVHFESDESGFTNVYEVDVRSGMVKPITAVTEEAWFAPLQLGERRLQLVTLARPHEHEMLVLDPATGAELGRRRFDATVRVLGTDRRQRFLIERTTAATPFQAEEMTIALVAGRAVWRLDPRLAPPPTLTAQVEQCRVERVTIPTFDQDPQTGGRRLLHAFLLVPKRPMTDASERVAVITGFYGGVNAYDTRAHVFCEAGIISLSPAVRGSAGFGRAFAALNDGDLGGREIADLFAAGRFLEARFTLKPSQIGVIGGSHGGYAAMRALTVGRITGDTAEPYPFGFGISHAGFSSILTFFETTNIPDWVKLEAGDPATERQKLLDRSPLTHVGRLRAPLLLTHGTNDNRVPVRESRQLNEAALAASKPVTYVEFEGQGHGLKGLEHVVRWYRVQLEFLEGVVRGWRAAP